MNKILNLGGKSDVLGEPVDLLGTKTNLGAPSKVMKTGTDKIGYPETMKKIGYPGDGMKY